MKYSLIPAENYIQARKAFAQQMASSSLAIFFSNDIYPTSADGTLPFKQSSDIFYLSGVDQEETILLLCPGASNPAMREILFLKETNEHIAVWEGAKLTKEQAKEQTGIQQVLWLGEWERVMRGLMNETTGIYYNENAHARAVVEVETREMRWNKKVQDLFPYHTPLRSAPILHQLRATKSSAELNQLQQAIDITRSGFERVMKMVKPGVKEYEIEAEYAHEFLKNGSRGFAYTPIVASGANACVLHYIANDQVCKDGDLLLMDVGAEYGNYNADMTRCIPVNGKFTARQKEVYNAVLRVMKQATSMLKPGVIMAEYQSQVGECMSKELVDLGLISMDDVRNQNANWPAYKKYFMHGTSHFLGLDVHDVGHWNVPIQEGNVFTVEPGIYIPEEGLGIRIENNIVITSEGNRDLFHQFLIEVEEIESYMHR